MNKDIDLSKFGHAASPFERKLIFDQDKEGLNIYSIPNDYEYLRVGYDDSENKNISYVDFDGGPFLSLGVSFIYKGNSYKVEKFTHNGSFQDIKVYLRKWDS